MFDKAKLNLEFVGTFVDGKISGPCWKFSTSGRFYSGNCDSINQFVAGSDVTVSSSKDEEIFTCKYTNKQVFTRLDGSSPVNCINDSLVIPQ